MNEFRHVCFKDLKNYIRKDSYFKDLTPEEKQEIRKNLEVPGNDDIKEQEQMLIYGTYKEIKQLVDDKKLSLQNKYIITDFRTIYRSNTDEVWGLDEKNPSKVYSVILTPTSSNTFDPRVSLLHEGNPLNWEVRYDFNEESLPGGKTTKGKITYLKDQRNNSAYYDFKNYKFQIQLKSSEVSRLPHDGKYDVYTFSKLEGNTFIDNSDDDGVYNNTFEDDCWTNVFIGNTSNNNFFGGFKNNVFTKGCEYNKFEWNTANNTFIEKVSYTQGSIQNAYVTNTNFDSSISKEFRMLSTNTSSKPVFVVTYFDGDTLTTQVTELSKE